MVLAETDKGVPVFAIPRDLPGATVYEGRNSATFGLRNGRTWTCASRVGGCRKII